MRIPAIQTRLRELAQAHSISELSSLADALYRRRPKRRAPATSAASTPELRFAIRAFAVAHPEMSQAEIAVHFRVNPGRVSEALRGKR